MTDFFSPKYGRRNPYFEQLLKEGTNTSPISSPYQGASRLAFALLAGLERRDLEQRERNLLAESPLQKRSPMLPMQDALPVIPDNKLR